MDQDVTSVVFAVGGSGGHLFPAQALANDLKRSGVQVTFAGVHLDTSPYFRRDMPYLSLKGASLKNPLHAVLRNLHGIGKSLLWLKKEKPSLVIGFGSFHSFPMLAAAYLLKIPYFLVAADSTMGRVNRLFQKRAQKVLSPFLHQSAELVALPSRLEALSKEEAASYYGLSPDCLTLLIFGGSQGALRLNQAIIKSFNKESLNSLQVIHFAGKGKGREDLENFYRDLEIPFVVKDFEERMEMAYSLADFAITRAGAITLQELISFEVPALLIPYPWAKAHQSQNAHFFVNHVKGGFALEERELTPENFVAHFNDLKRERKPFKTALKRFRSEERQLSLTELVLKWLETR